VKRALVMFLLALALFSGLFAFDCGYPALGRSRTFTPPMLGGHR